ncbi:MAG: roadblock/LC7 domain-containing protein [Candidatus Thermoplasmatota archaeon]|nr:roadblock/LC7 domain-containing protein [Candidatus Thermoplasmatota archaeon]
MTDIPRIEEILKEIESLEGVNEAILVSRSGMYIAGTLPSNVHQETYASMFAVLLGAADTATSELEESLSSVVINMESSKMVVITNGPKAIYVLRVAQGVKIGHLRDTLRHYTDRLQESL